ncbi:MAG TPA: 50S ribosomal protein L3 N(5)-glutamine methyltransferase [Gammaproteobacteria bacterium]|nr:50S ribosomal protein L3 N(5)-glutamine methyltransferase [Gammaproteobacteria bacterium]
MLKISTLSMHPKRKIIYDTILEACRKNEMTIKKISSIGGRLMRQGNLHHHFFMDHSLYTTAIHLALFSLNLDFKKNDKNFLNIKITEKEAANIIQLYEKRISERLPVEYITHESHYLEYKFYVNEHVLVPRSVMNTQFDEFLQQVNWKNYRVLDLGTGSGCIGITLALMKSNITVDLADISEKALSVAKININRYQLEDRVRCIQSDLFNKIHETYDLIITNPPYVSCSEYQRSPAEFKTEPKLALEAGKNGLDIIDQILMNARRYLNSQGMLIAEVGGSTAKQLKKKYPKLPFKWLKYKRPTHRASKFDFWVDRIFGLDCIFQCQAKELPMTFNDAN